MGVLKWGGGLPTLPTNTALDRGSLQNEIDLPHTLAHMLCLWEEG